MLSAETGRVDSSLGKMTTYVVEDDEGTVDSADGVVSNSGNDRVRGRLARIRHDGRNIGK